MTLQEFRNNTKDIPEDIANRTILCIGIRDENDIVNNEDGTISFPEFSEIHSVDSINLIIEGSMAPKMFLTTIRKNYDKV